MGAAVVAAARPPSRQPAAMPATLQRAVIPQNFMIKFFPSIVILRDFPVPENKVAEDKWWQTCVTTRCAPESWALQVGTVMFAAIPHRLAKSPTRFGDEI